MEDDLPPEQIAEAKRRLHEGLGTTLLLSAYRYITPIFWATQTAGGPKLHHSGTAFLLECGGPLLLVTAAHVYRAYETDAATHPNVVMQIGNIAFTTTDALIAIDDALDIVTLKVDDRVPERLDLWVYRRSSDMWPPPPPEQGKGVFFAGFPEVHREEVASGELVFGAYGALLTATSVTADHIVCQLERDRLEDVHGRGLPPPNQWLGGMSGAPAWTLTQVGWRLAGVLYEYSRNYELFYIRRPEAIRPDGTIVAI